MGANLDYRIMDDGHLGTIEKEWQAQAEQSRYQDGNQYSGRIGMLCGRVDFRDVELGTRYEAVDYLDDMHNKWDRPIAVSYRNLENVKRWIIGGWCSS